MPEYVVKHGGIWSAGKLVPTGGSVTLDAADAKFIDPDGSTLVSLEDMKAEAAKKKAEAAELAKKAAELEAEAKKKADKGGSK